MLMLLVLLSIRCCRFWSQKQGEFLLSSGSKSAKLEGLVSSIIIIITLIIIIFSKVSATLSHALVSMLVTSLTTTAAFLASLVSNVTAIKCFRSGIIADKLIMSAYFLSNSTLLMLKPHLMLYVLRRVSHIFVV